MYIFRVLRDSQTFRGTKALIPTSFRLPHLLAELLKPIPIVIVVSVVIALGDPLKALSSCSRRTAPNRGS